MLAWLVVSGAPAQVAYLDHQHMDFRLRYYPGATGSNQLDIVLGYDSGTDHFVASNQQVYIVGGTNAQLIIPANPDYNFLGAPGLPIWILPQSQNITLPYVGTSAEDIPSDVFDGPLRFELRSVEGPGNFFAWANTGAGQPPIIKFICTNGVVATQYNVMTPFTGSHEHYNWGFSTNGLYRVTFRVVGQRIGEATNIVGKEVSWAFQLLPLRPWEYWVSTNWLPATASSTNGPAADPDGDGIVNVLEYAFGNDPNSARYTNAPAIAFVNAGGTNYGALRYVQAINATDLTLDPRASSIIGGMSESITNITDVSSNGATQTVTVRDSISKAATPDRFYQLRVKLNYP
jgi:surface-anchored protein